MKTVDVRRKDHKDRCDRAEGLHALDHVAATDLLNEFFEKPKHELLGNHVRHEKRAALRFADFVQLLGEFRLYFRSGKITGKLLPDRHVCGFKQFEDFSRQDSLSGQARFFCEREFRWVPTFHESRKHFFQQRGARAELFVKTIVNETSDRIVEAVRKGEGSSTLASGRAVAVADLREKFCR